MVFEKAVAFINSIGIDLIYTDLEKADCFLPGFMIVNGKIMVDKNQVKSPGDILHEAAHIAVVPATDRATLKGETIGKRKDADAEEMMSIAWSYAACIHLAIDPHFVFHEDGYRGGGSSIVENFSSGKYIGVSVLQWLGMTSTSAKDGTRKQYPEMIKWLRD